MPFKNPGDTKNYQREYRMKRKDTEKRKKQLIIGRWKHYGIVETDYYTYDELYELYMLITECENCGIELTENVGHEKKCLDHCHKTGIFRNVLCHSCNVIRGP